jgi:hypothetical protein
LSYIITIEKARGNPRCKSRTTSRSSGADLTSEQREEAERIGRLEYASTRNPFRYRAHETVVFIPSREQH